MNIIGARIVIALASMGKDLQWLASEMHCKRATLRSLLYTAGAESSAKTIDALVRALDVTPTWLTTADARRLGPYAIDALFHCAAVIRTTMRGERRDARGEANARIDRRRRPPDLFRERGATSVARVVGESLMLFGLIDGDLVYLETAHSLRGVANRLVLFEWNGELHLRRLTIGAGGQARMFSGHLDYDPVRLLPQDKVAIRTTFIERHGSVPY